VGRGRCRKKLRAWLISARKCACLTIAHCSQDDDGHDLPRSDTPDLACQSVVVAIGGVMNRRNGSPPVRPPVLVWRLDR
jgi:predicted flavoprotein YhiN